jgi:hypothetical protein
VEILIVVGIIAILAAMVISLAARIDSRGNERLVENTFALLNAALGEFRDYGYSYKDSKYDGFEFPLDCDSLESIDLEDTLKKALDASTVSIRGGNHNLYYSGSEALYFFLSKVPESRKTLDKIHRSDKQKIVGSLITNEDSSGVGLVIRIDDANYPLMRIIDPWGRTLRYDYYDDPNNPKLDEARTFPVITSAGPDGVFGTDDDMKSR